MKPIDITALRALHERATKNWRQGAVEKHHVFTPDGATMSPLLGRVLFRANEHFPHEDDVALAVEARNALPALLDAIEQFRALARAVQEARGMLVDSGFSNVSERLLAALDVPGVRPVFRAGDVVKHHPTGETWTLAYAENERGDVSACGWPESIARAADCSLVLAATDEEHVAMLRDWAETQRGGGHDYRSVVCKRQLAALERK